MQRKTFLDFVNEGPLNTILPISDLDGIITLKSSKSSEYQKLNDHRLLILMSPIQTPDKYPYL